MGGTLSRAADPLHQKEPVEVVWASGKNASPRRCSRHLQLRGGLREDPGLSGEIRPVQDELRLACKVDESRWQQPG